MSSRHGARLCALLVPAALLLPSAAHAEKVVTHDSVGDVQSFTFDDTGDETLALTPAPEETTADITRVVAAHGNRRLSIAVHFRDLALGVAHATFVKIHTPKQGAFVVDVDRVPGSRATAALGSRRGQRPCRGIRAAFDETAEVVSVSVPTACLDNPRWVQLGVGAISLVDAADTMDPATWELFVDDGHRDVVREKSLGRGPRIHRG